MAARPARTSRRLRRSAAGRGSRPRARGCERAAERADQVAHVVGAGEPARAVQVDDAVVQHHRQDRREREAADAHRDGERDQPGDGDRRGARALETLNAAARRSRPSSGSGPTARLGVRRRARRSSASMRVDGAGDATPGRRRSASGRSGRSRSRAARLVGRRRRRAASAMPLSASTANDGERARAALAGVEEAAVGA